MSKHIFNINNQICKEQNSKVIELSKKYVNFIQDLNKQRKSSSKNFYILIKNSKESIKIENLNYEERAIEELNEKYFKIKECISRCGNVALEYEDVEEVKEILFSFFNTRIYMNNWKILDTYK